MRRIHYFYGLAFVCFVLVTCTGCTQKSESEKHQAKRENIIHVHDNIKEIDMEEIPIGRIASLSMIDDYLLVVDVLSQDNLIHIFDKKDFNYVTSMARRGEGPNEITNIGYVGVNDAERIFYVSDHGKQKIFSYELDSVLKNPLYEPGVKMRMNQKSFPSRYQYINETLSIGVIIEPTGNSGFKQSIAKWNMNTGEIKPMEYVHPDIEKKRINFAISVENGIYVECYSYHDLMTICSMDGNLKYNVYGDSWDDKNSNKVSHYGQVAFCNDKIVALYLGSEHFHKDEKGGVELNYPTKFLVFSINGDYIKTLETGYQITGFCYDKDNNRIIMNMEDVMQFAYLDLDGLVD